MKRLLALALAAALQVGAAAAHDAAKCTEVLTGTWKIAIESASLTLDLAAGGVITVTAEMTGQPPESSKGTWSADAGTAADQCLLKTVEEGQTEGDATVVTVKDDNTIELAEMGVFTRQ